ncbi:MAG: hypothetical protein ABI612_24865, partial [Betaproteobacteria bacterium]
PEIVEQPDELRAIVHDWHPGIGSALLQSLDLPESISRACDEHELPPSLLPPGSLSELISVANRCSISRQATPEPVAEFMPSEPPNGGLDDETARSIVEEASREVESLLAALKG